MDNYYITLGISSDATPDEVRQAYLRLAKMYHPDKNKSPDATVTMAEINLAYETLCDRQRREQYDLENHVVIENKMEDVPWQEYNEDEEVGQDSSQVLGKCVKCNFINSSGMFVCSVCGYTFDPEAGSKKESQYHDRDDDISYEELDNGGQNEQNTMSEIIRCPQCNEINMYSHGSCWQCGLDFHVEEAVEL